MKKAILFERRKKAKELYEQKCWRIRKISRYLVTNKNHVCKWVKMSEEELQQDNRGWKKGRPRKNTKQQKKEIKKMRKKLEKEESIIIGAKVVHANYNKSHKTKVSKDFVDRTLKE